MKNKKVVIELTEEELNNLINDTLHYLLELEDRKLTSELYGYNDRLQLLDKLKAISRTKFPKLEEGEI